MSHIAIVPARAGSKGVPGKNLRTIGGLSLVHRALKAAIDSGIFEEIILTTDIPFLLEEKNTEWTVHPRSASIALDTTPMTEVVLDLIEKRRIQDHQMLWLLQPTSPFRVNEDFQTITEILKDPDVRSVISATAVGDSHPSRHYTLSRFNDLRPILGGLSHFENRQALKPVYERNGLYYVAQCHDYKRASSFYIPRCKAYLIDKSRAFNINDELDFKIAQAVASWT